MKAVAVECGKGFGWIVRWSDNSYAFVADEGAARFCVDHPGLTRPPACSRFDASSIRLLTA